ncbi:ComEC/Rec2 family competence protein [Desulfovulcanus sp.]
MGSSAVLLFWQRCLLLYVIGLWIYKFPAPGLCVLFLAFIFLAPRKLVNSLVLILFFLAGLGIAHLFYPRPPIKVPASILLGHKVNFHGKIEKIRSIPDHKLRLFIEKVQLEDQGKTWTLPGYLLLTWERPSGRRQRAGEKNKNLQTVNYMPDVWPGQEISGRLRIKPVHGPVNEGCWNSEFYWHRQKVFFRSYYYDKNSSTSPSLTLTPIPTPTLTHNLRLNLRQKIIHIFDKYFEDEPRIKGLALALLMNERYFLSSEFVDRIRLSSLGV